MSENSFDDYLEFHNCEIITRICEIFLKHYLLIASREGVIRQFFFCKGEVGGILF